MPDNVVFVITKSLGRSIAEDFTADWIRQIWLAVPPITLVSDIDEAATTLLLSSTTFLAGGSWQPSYEQTGFNITPAILPGMNPLFSLGGPSVPIPTHLNVGDCLLLPPFEAMIIQTIGDADEDGHVPVTVTRGVAQNTPSGSTQFPLAEPIPHTAGTIVSLLRYPTPWAMIDAECFTPYMKRKRDALGNLSSGLQGWSNGSIG